MYIYIISLNRKQYPCEDVKGVKGVILKGFIKGVRRCKNDTLEAAYEFGDLGYPNGVFGGLVSGQTNRALHRMWFLTYTHHAYEYEYRHLEYGHSYTSYRQQSLLQKKPPLFAAGIL